MASNDSFGQPNNSAVPRIVGIVGGIAVLAVAGWFVAAKFLTHTPPPAASAAVQHDSAKPSTVANASTAGKPAPVVTAKAAPATATAAAANPHAAAPHVVNASHVSTAPQVASASNAATEGNGAPVVTAVGQPTPVNASHLDDHVTYQYNALGRRDPFQSLVDGQFIGADVGGDAPPDPGGIKVVGIVWGASDQFALVEDVRGNSFVLRKGDKVQNGVVEGLKRDGLIVNITAEGQSQSVVIPLTRKGEQNAR